MAADGRVQWSEVGVAAAAPPSVAALDHLVVDNRIAVVVVAAVVVASLVVPKC